ncbi:MAG TPA: glycosyltransferase [Candidatus Krumholzibacteria bacterium]|nr:glycosyltransferase [Candidatus Krumholzibacteria bacterium]
MTRVRTPRIAYVASEFPRLTETFVLREVGEMERRGIAVSLFSIRPRPTRTLHADAKPYLEKTHYAPWFGVAHMAAFFSLLIRKPAGVMRGIGFLLRDSIAHARYPAVILKTFLATAKLFLFTKQMEDDGVVHVHGHFANIPTTQAALAARVLGITYSFTGHAWDIFVPRNQAGLAEKIHGAQFVATCTGFNSRLLSNIAQPADRAKIVLNYHGLDLAAYRASAARDDNRIVAGGSLVEQKGLRYLIDAAALLRDRGLDFRIEIVGDGPLFDAFAEQINKHQLMHLVALVGSMPHEELMLRMGSAAMVVLPCIETSGGYMDGIPNILIESLALEVPVVSSNISGVPELVVPGENGLLNAPRDVPALADAIESLLRDPERARAMGRAGRARVEKMFDLRRNASELVSKFDGILEAAGRARG